MSNRKPVNLNSAGTKKLQALIAQHPGSTSAQLVVLSSYSLAHIKNILCVLSSNNIALPVPRGVDRHWYMEEQAKPLLEQWDRTRRKRGLKQAKPMTKRDRIHAMSKEPGGVSMAQIMAALDLQLNDGGRHCLMMVHQGRLFRATRPGARLRWFDTPERAAEWEALPPMQPSEWSEPRRKAWAEAPKRVTREEIRKANRLARLEIQKKQMAERLQHRQISLKSNAKKKERTELYTALKVKAAEPAPVTLHTKPSDIRGAVDYSKAKVIVCPAPTHDARYQVDPRALVIGEFSKQWRELRGGV